MTNVPPFGQSGPPDGPMPLEAVFARAWALLRTNWFIALPPIVVVTLCLSFAAPFVVATFSTAFGHGDHLPRPHVPGWAMASFAVAYAAMLLGGFSAIVMMFGMADAAWAGGGATFGDGFSALGTRSGALAAASLGLLGVSLLALILALPTLGLSMLAFVVFTIYVMPAVVGGGRGGFAALAESFRLVRSSFVRSAIGIALLIAGSYAISFAGYFSVLPLTVWFMKVVSEPSRLQTLPAPPVALIVACGSIYLVITILSLAYYGYYALVLVGMYRSLVGPGQRAGSVAGTAADAPGG